MRIICTAAIALGLSVGCSSTETAPVNPLVVNDAPSTTEAPQEAPKASTTSKLTAGAATASANRCKDGLVGMSTKGAWLGHDQDGWNGTGAIDVDPFKKLPDEVMLDRALNGGEHAQDRGDALVSVGRRKAPGAIRAFKAALETSNAIQVREAAMNGMIEHGGDEILGMFWDILNDDESSWLRGKAIWGIAAYTPEEAQRAIETGLADPSPEVKGMAILAMPSVRDRPEFIFPLLDELAESKERKVWQEVATILPDMPYSQAARILERVARATPDDEKRVLFVSAYRRWVRAFPDLCR